MYPAQSTALIGTGAVCDPEGPGAHNFDRRRREASCWPLSNDHLPSFCMLAPRLGTAGGGRPSGQVLRGSFLAPIGIRRPVSLRLPSQVPLCESSAQTVEVYPYTGDPFTAQRTMLASCLPRTCHHLCKTAVSRASAVPTGVLRAVRTDQDTSQQPAPQSEAQERSSAPASTSRQNPNAQRLKVCARDRLVDLEVLRFLRLHACNLLQSRFK